MKWMRRFQRLLSRILIIITSAVLAGVSIPQSPLHEDTRTIVAWIAIGITAALGIWGIIWEYYFADKRKLRRDGWRFKRFFSNWYDRPGKLVICCGSLSWMVSQNGSKSDSRILDALSLSNNRIAKASSLQIITSNIDDHQLHELWKRLHSHGTIEVYKVEEDTINAFSFSRYAAAGDAQQYIIKYNSEDRDGYIFEHTNVTETAFIDSLIDASCIEKNRRMIDLDELKKLCIHSSHIVSGGTVADR